LATGLLTTGADSSNRAAGTLSRPKMLAAVAPTIRKQVSAMMVMAFVKQLSTSPGHSLSPKLGNN
jgi:predicted alpha/beta-fold hydrolase